jgi:hypothetical protein
MKYYIMDKKTLKVDKLSKMLSLKSVLKTTSKFQEISDIIVELLKQVPDIETLKLNNELILYICNIVEELCKKKYKINKLDLLLATLIRVIPSITEDEKKLITDIVEFFHANKQIIGVTKIAKFASMATGILKKLV